MFDDRSQAIKQQSRYLLYTPLEAFLLRWEPRPSGDISSSQTTWTPDFNNCSESVTLAKVEDLGVLVHPQPL
jgi:hypothetical protein